MVVQQSKSLDILLVEDSLSDADLTRRALTKGSIRNTLHHVSDGVEAMEFLRHEGSYHDVPRPDLILLDLNMPRMDGKGVLRELQADDMLRLIPVVVLTTSDDEEDILDSYVLNSNAYIVKPVDMQRFYDVVQTTHDFWVGVASLPPSRIT